MLTVQYDVPVLINKCFAVIRLKRLSVLAIILLMLLATPVLSAPDAPTNLSGSTDETSYTLNWDSVPGAVAYNIYRDNAYLTTTQTTTYSSALNDGEVANFFIVSVTDDDPREFSVASESITLPASAVPDDLTIPPSVPTDLDGSVSGPTVSLSWTASTDDEKVSGYNVYENNNYVTTVFETTWLGAITPGSKNIYNIVAFDVRGNFSSASDNLLLPKSTSTNGPSRPTPPNELTGSITEGTSSTVVNLNWSAATDDGLVLGYNVYENGAYVATVFDTSYSGNVDADKVFSYNIVAFDNDKLFSENSETLSLPDTGEEVDTTIPPAPVEQISGSLSSAGKVQLSWSAANDDRGIAGYNIYENNAYQTTVSDNNYMTDVDASQIYTYSIVAFDIDGNFASPSEILTLPEGAAAQPDTEPPTTPSAFDGDYIVGDGDDADSVVLQWQASTDDHSVSGYNIYENNQYLTTVFDTRFEKNVSSDDSYSYYVIAFDAAGNFSTPSNRVTVPDQGNQAPFFEGLTDTTIFAGDTLNLLLKPVDIDGPLPGMFPGALPEGMYSEDNFDGTRSLRWSPLQPAVGYYDISVTAIDAVDPTLQTTETFRLTVVLPDDPSGIINLPPAIDLIEPHVARTGDTIIMEVKGTDPNGTVPVLTLLNPPENSTFVQHEEFPNVKVLTWMTTVSDLGTTILEFEAVDADDISHRYEANVELTLQDTSSFDRPGVRLKDLAAAKNIKLGYASLLQYFNRPDADLYQATAREEFDLVTTENSMKWAYINPEPGKYRWEAADTLMNFAQQNDMTTHGHTLVWYAGLPQWVQTSETSERETLMYNFIDTMTERYPDVDIWDVVNEAFEEDGSYRNSVWYQAMGKDHIHKAFIRTREQDPDATLIYNDYDISWAGPKSDAAYTLMQELLSSSVPIDGIGFQMHLDTGFNDIASVKERFAAFAALGLDIYITELDVSMLDGDSDQDQARIYGEVADACLAEPACKALQIWGITDRYSWRKPNDPLIFDRNYQPKPAYFALQDSLSAP